MKNTTLEFLKPGLHTLIQDLGRTSHRGEGVPVGGALDKSSAILANKLVGNDANSPVFEITITGPRIRFIGDACLIGITGADISPALNGKPIGMYRSVRVTPNSILDFGKLNTGCRTYLSVKGDWRIQKWLGSASAIFPDLPAVTPDSFITKGSTIDIKHSGLSTGSTYSSLATPRFRDSNIIRVMPGPEITMFSQVAIEKFSSISHTITPASNRWGYRLDSELPMLNPGQEIISSGVIPGTIQVVHSGEPIILMADGQTTGGYPRIAVVISADLDRLAQFKPGDTVRFRIVELEEALAAGSFDIF